MKRRQEKAGKLNQGKNREKLVESFSSKLSVEK